MPDHRLKRKGAGRVALNIRVGSHPTLAPNLSLNSGGVWPHAINEEGVSERNGRDASFPATSALGSAQVVLPVSSGYYKQSSRAKVSDAQSVRRLEDPLPAESAGLPPEQQARWESARYRDKTSRSPKHKRDPSAQDIECQKRLCQYPVSFNESAWETQTRSNLPDCDRPHQVCLSSGPEDELLLFNIDESTRQEPRHASFAAAAMSVSSNPSARGTERSHPLSNLKWPFDEAFFGFENSRGGGGGGGTQPSTTGSQGFPQFVTAGPTISLLDHRIFGYEQEDAILWA